MRKFKNWLAKFHPSGLADKDFVNNGFIEKGSITPAPPIVFIGKIMWNNGSIDFFTLFNSLTENAPSCNLVGSTHLEIVFPTSFNFGSSTYLCTTDHLSLDGSSWYKPILDGLNNILTAFFVNGAGILDITTSDSSTFIYVYDIAPD